MNSKPRQFNHLHALLFISFKCVGFGGVPQHKNILLIHHRKALYHKDKKVLLLILSPFSIIALIWMGVVLSVIIEDVECIQRTRNCRVHPAPKLVY